MVADGCCRGARRSCIARWRAGRRNLSLGCWRRRWPAYGRRKDRGVPLPAALQVIEVESRPVLAIWRSNGVRTAALAGFAERFMSRNVAAGYAYQLADAAGQRIAGAASIPPQTVARVIGDPRNPWMLRIWSDSAATAGGSRLGPRLLLAMLATMILFLWGTVYFMARAIRREAAIGSFAVGLRGGRVPRVPFPAHHRAPVVRDAGDGPGPQRRPPAEVLPAFWPARRSVLQRLVETLLNFGKMEAGAQQYRFEELDVGGPGPAGRARRIEPQARKPPGGSKSAGPKLQCVVLADADALASGGAQPGRQCA